MTDYTLRQWAGFVLGMVLTSASLSSGFIWACGAQCSQEALIWTPARQTILVFGAALTAWIGYLIAHYMITGTVIDQSAHGMSDEGSSSNEQSPVQHSSLHHLGVLTGVGILVLGMVIGVIYIRQGDHLMTNLGGILFLGGYAIAHYIETGKPV